MGTTLTPVGAEKAGNKDGTIPEWTGGMTTAPSGWKPGQKRVDPYAADKPLFTIDASNLDRYRDKLSEGQATIARDAVVVHCAAPGLKYQPLLPIWGTDAITLQLVRAGSPSFGAAMVGYIEATRDILQKHGGLWFYDESFVISRRRE